MARGSFTFVVVMISLVVFGLAYVFISPFWNIILNFASQLVPEHAGTYAIFEMFFGYIPVMFFIGGILIYVIISAMDPN